jgi:hypothetical protein
VTSFNEPYRWKWVANVHPGYGRDVLRFASCARLDVFNGRDESS